MTEQTVLIWILFLMLFERTENSKHPIFYWLLLGWITFKLVMYGVL